VQLPCVVVRNAAASGRQQIVEPGDQLPRRQCEVAAEAGEVETLPRLNPLIRGLRRQRLFRLPEKRPLQPQPVQCMIAAGVCRALTTFVISKELCTGCMACAKVCPVDAITGAKKKLHVIDQEKCTRCGACRTVCRFDAVRTE